MFHADSPQPGDGYRAYFEGAMPKRTKRDDAAFNAALRAVLWGDMTYDRKNPQPKVLEALICVCEKAIALAKAKADK